MKRVIYKIIILVALSFCFLLGGCTDALYSCTEVGQGLEALSSIEAYGDYTFQQGSTYIYKNEKFSIASVLAGKRAEYGMKKGSQSEGTYIVEKDDYIYTLYRFGRYTKDDVSYRDVLIARAPRANPRDLKVVVALKKVTGREPYIYILGDYLVFCSNNIYVYDTQTFNRVKQYSIDYFAGDEAWTEGEYFAICDYNGNGKGYTYTILDEDLNEYKFNNTYELRRIDLYKDYFIVKESEVYNFKTNELLDAETASLIYQENEKRNEAISAERQMFTYNGAKYSWHAEDTQNPENMDETNGNSYYTYYPDLVITNLQTGERHVFLQEEFSKQASEIINALGTMIYCEDILSENGELYFVYAYHTPDFQKGDTPGVFFKYDEQSGKLLYIGSAYYSYLTHVYRGKIF
ncbi:MAG: hypothetical protein IKA99_04715 [Clostridia bacterium]|nr:hypothetical protein [Clostridia bacterium]